MVRESVELQIAASVSIYKNMKYVSDLGNESDGDYERVILSKSKSELLVFKNIEVKYLGYKVVFIGTRRLLSVKNLKPNCFNNFGIGSNYHINEVYSLL